MTGKRLSLLITLALCLIVSLPAASQSGNGYALTWHTIDNGGVTFNMGNGYQLGGSVGQPDAGSLSSGDYTLVGGFWQGKTVVGNTRRVYLPLVLRQVP
jgi:hypothetical protein